MKNIHQKIMSKCTKLFWSLALLAIVAVMPAFAQVSLNVTIKRPTPSELSEWRRDPSIVRVVINNTSPNEYRNTFISIIIRDLNKSKIVARTKDGDPSIPRFTIPAMQTRIVTGPDIINQQAIELDASVKDQALNTDALPEGDYEFCVKLLAEDGRTVITETNPCQIFTVLIPDPPRLIKPVDEMALPTTSLPLFSWTPVTPQRPGSRISYRLKIVPVFEGQDLRTAIEHNDVVMDKRINMTTYQYLPSDKLFSTFPTAAYFAWQIQALDVSRSMVGTPATRNEGKSEIAKFGFKKLSAPLAPLALFVLDPEKDQQLQVVKPVFSVYVNRKVNRAGILGGTFSLWEKKPNESDVIAMKGAPVFTHTFSGNSESDLPLSPGLQPSDRTNFDIGFLNRPGSPMQYQVKWATAYVWKFSLNYNSQLLSGPNNGIPQGTQQLFSDLGSFNTGSQVVNVLGDDCTGPCIVNAPANTNVLATPLIVGDSIKIGQFMMNITVLTNPSNASLTGEGFIRVPVFKAGINVSFNGLKVNTNKEVFVGVAQAIILPTISIPQANNLGQRIGLNAQKLQEIQQLVGMAGRLVSGFTGYEPINLPIGLDNVIPGTGEKITVAIIGAQFSPTGAGFNAALDFPLPFFGPDQRLGFGANDICLHPGGIGTNNTPTTMYLIEDFGYNQNSNSTFAVELKAPFGNDPGTFVAFNCEGFKSLHINGEVNFPTDWIKPVPDNGQRVRMNLVTDIVKDSLKNWMFNVQVNTAFAPTSLPDFIINCQNMWIDFSDLKNAPGMKFPTPYQGPNKNQPTWHGFYMPSMTMTLPNSIKTGNNPVTIQITDLLIDGTGFTVQVDAANVIQYPSASITDWGASVDSISFAFANSSFINGKMLGRLGIPISDSTLVYSAILSKVNNALGFQFSIVPKDTIAVPLWVATMNLEPTSSFLLTVGQGQAFNAALTLDGHISLAGQIGGFKLCDLIGLQFQGLTLSSQAPYFQLGNFSLTSPDHGVGGFKAGLTHFEPKFKMEQSKMMVGLGLGLSVALAEGDFGVAGEAVFSVWGSYNPTTKAKQFEKAEMDSIVLDCTIGAAVDVHGIVRFYYEDPTFGQGFIGAIDATILESIQATATLQFGNKKRNGANGQYTYWYVDATVIGPAPGIPLATGIALRGAGIGVWVNMDATLDNAQTPGQNQQAQPVNASVPGISNCGISYLPNEAMGFGLKAKVILATQPSNDLFNADVSFGMEFLDNGGLGTMMIIGQGYMLTDVFDRQDPRLYCGVTITYDAPTKTFDAALDLSINMPPFITGGGNADFHVDPNMWYLWVGHPNPIQNRPGVEIMSLFNSKAYFQIGSVIDPLASLPQEVLIHMSDDVKQRFANRTDMMENALNNGGVGFGSWTGFDTGKLRFGPFYAQLLAGFGWDAALVDFGDQKCNGSNSVVGIDGWYMNAQAYAYLEGKVGISIDVLIASGDFDIFSVSAGAALKAQLPNPTWAAGVVYGNYSILGGLISGDCEFEFEIGDKCKLPASNPLDNIELISDFRPEDGSSNAEVFSLPQAAFSFPVDKKFDLDATNGNGDPIVRSFRVKIKDFIMSKESNASNISGNWGVKPGGLSALFVPGDALPSMSWVKATITAYAEELVNNAWKQAVYSQNAAPDKKGKNIEQTESRHFKTGNQPAVVPLQNVLYTYPLDRQRYYLQNEKKSGGIYLKQGQPDIFDPNQREGYISKFLIQFMPVHGGNNTPIETPISYSNANKQLSFTIPTLSNNTLFRAVVVRRDSLLNNQGNNVTGLVNSKDANALAALSQTSTSTKNIYSKTESTISEGAVSANPGQVGKSYVENSSLKSSVNITAANLLKNLVLGGDKKLFQFHFRTSKFNTVSQKFASGSIIGVSKVMNGNAVIVKPKFGIGEALDQYDVKGFSFNKIINNQYVTVNNGPLILPQSDEQTKLWHTQYALPEIYNVITKINQSNTTSGFFKSVFDPRPMGTQYSSRKNNHTLVQYNLVGTTDHSLLKDYEIAPLMQGGIEIPGNGVGMVESYPGGGAVYAGNVTLEYCHGEAAATDYNTLQNKINTYFSKQYVDGYNANKSPIWTTVGADGDPNPTSATIYGVLQNVFGKQFKKIYGGTYPLHLKYQILDNTLSTYNTTFTYQP